MNWRFTISVALMFVMLFVLGWLVHDGLLKDDYERIRHLLRPMDDTRGKILYVFLAQLCTSLAFVWLYLRGVENKGWLAQGFRYGLDVTLLTTIPINLVQYAVMPIPFDFALKRMCYDIVVVVLMGVVLAFIYRGASARHG